MYRRHQGFLKIAHILNNSSPLVVRNVISSIPNWMVSVLLIRLIKTEKLNYWKKIIINWSEFLRRIISIYRINKISISEKKNHLHHCWEIKKYLKWKHNWSWMRRKGCSKVGDMYKLIQIIYQVYSVLANRNSSSRITSK